MSHYICPECGSSLDAGEKCSCGARDKPVISAAGHGKTDTPQRIWITTASRNSPIYDKMQEMQRMVVMSKEEHEELHRLNRKEIYENLCRKTKTSQ